MYSQGKGSGLGVAAMLVLGSVRFTNLIGNQNKFVLYRNGLKHKYLDLPCLILTILDHNSSSLKVISSSSRRVHTIDLPCVLTQVIVESASYCQVLSQGRVIRPSLVHSLDMTHLKQVRSLIFLFYFV